MKKIDLNEWVKSGEGFEADSYNNTKDDSVILKLFRPNILKSRIEDSFNAAIEYEKIGVLTPKAYEMVEVDGRIGVIFERIKDKISLYRMFVNNHELAEEVATMFGDSLREFHAKTIDKSKAISRIANLKAITSGMIHISDFISDDKKDILSKKVLSFFDKFESEAEEPNLAMGDCHIGNVILSHDKLYFIDLSSLQYGSPHIDLGWVFSGYDNPLVDAAVPKEEMIPAEYKNRFLDKFKSVYFKGKSADFIEEEIKKSKKCGQIQDLLLHIYISKNVEAIEKILEI
ncbi:MAG: phosphotransferase [Lachnospiraceae bacterium]|nr:phosphotransferase [Lachnospiraceae bacterium]